MGVGFAERLRELKERDGLTIEGMAEKIGCGTSTVRAWLYRDQEPTMRMLIRISNAFKVKLDWLTGVEEPEEIRLDCPACGGEKTVVGYRSPYNGHFHGVCEECGARIFE